MRGIRVTLCLSLVLVASAPSGCGISSRTPGDSTGGSGGGSGATGGSKAGGSAGLGGAGGHAFTTPNPGGFSGTASIAGSGGSGATAAGGGSPSAGRPGRASAGRASAGTSSSEAGAPSQAGAGGEGPEPCGGPETSTADELIALIQEFEFQDPSFNRDTIFEVHDEEIYGLWPNVRVEIFDAYYSLEGVPSDGPSKVFMYHDGKVEPLFTAAGIGLNSAIVRDSSLYYSYSNGSGIYRSQIGRLTRVGCEIERVESGGYIVDLGSTHRQLFLEVAGQGLDVLSALYWNLNTWTDSAAQIGHLGETDSSLFIVDDEGQPILPDFPNTL